MTLRGHKNSYTERLDYIPPPVAWLLARNRRRPLSLEEVARKAGITQRWLREILKKTTWAEVPVGLVDRIRSACGILPSNEWRHLEYLRRTVSQTRIDSALYHLKYRNPMARVSNSRALLDWKQSTRLPGRLPGS